MAGDAKNARRAPGDIAEARAMFAFSVHIAAPRAVPTLDRVFVIDFDVHHAYGAT